MFCQYIFVTKTLWKMLQKYFLFLFLFDHHQIFAANLKIFATKNFKIFDLKCKLEKPCTIHINTNTVFFFNLAKTFFIYRKFNSIIIEIISKLFIGLCNSFWVYFYKINMPNMIPQKTLLIIILDVGLSLFWTF